MNFVKMLVELPILIIILIFAFVNNDFVSFSLWPFFIELTVSQSVVIVVLILFGFLMGKLDSYFLMRRCAKHCVSKERLTAA